MAAMRDARQRLPAFAQKQDVVARLAAGRVLVVSGATGSSLAVTGCSSALQGGPDLFDSKLITRYSADGRSLCGLHQYRSVCFRVHLNESNSPS